MYALHFYNYIIKFTLKYKDYKDTLKASSPAHHNPSKCITSRSMDWRSTYDLGKVGSLKNIKVTESFSFAEKHYWFYKGGGQGGGRGVEHKALTWPVSSLKAKFCFRKFTMKKWLFRHHL